MTRTMKDLKAQARHLDPVVSIGKNGLTDGLVAQVDHDLKRSRLIKVQIRKSAADRLHRKELAEELAKRTNAKLVDMVGGVAILHR